MNNKEIYYRNGFFRLTNGHWIPAMFDRFCLDSNRISEDVCEYYIMGVQGSPNMPMSLAGPFDSKESAQKALDAFFILGGMNVSAQN